MSRRAVDLLTVCFNWGTIDSYESYIMDVPRKPLDNDLSSQARAKATA